MAIEILPISLKIKNLKIQKIAQAIILQQESPLLVLQTLIMKNNTE